METEKIDTFFDLIDWIFYCWDYPYKLERHGDDFVLNKLYITKTRLTYKTETYALAPGLYEDLETFYQLLNKKQGIG